MANVDQLTPAAVRVDSPFASALRRGRHEYNERFLHMRHAKPSLDAASFSRVLSAVVAPVIDSWASYAGINLDEAVSTLYDVSLELTAGGILGAPGSAQSVDEAWQSVLPLAPHLAQEDVLGLLTAVSNATYNVLRVPGAKHALFVLELGRLASVSADLSTFRELGKVLAWRCGLAHYRDGALDALSKLSPTLVSAALGLSKIPEMPSEEFSGRLREDPWLHPFSVSTGTGMRVPVAIRVVREIGAFRGYGGAFLVPPQVVFTDGHFWATDSTGWWTLHADIFGATCMRASAPSEAEILRPEKAGLADSMLRNARDLFSGGTVSRPTTDAGFSVTSQGLISIGNDKLSLPKTDKVSSFAVHNRTLMLTVTTSHKVFVIARPSVLL